MEVSLQSVSVSMSNVVLFYLESFDGSFNQRLSIAYMVLIRREAEIVLLVQEERELTSFVYLQAFYGPQADPELPIW